MRDKAGRFAADDVEIGTCKLALLRIQRRFLLDDAVLPEDSAPTPKTS